MVAAAGAGPSPIPHKDLNVDTLAEGIRYCLTERATTAASTIAIKMGSEIGVQAAVSSFHRHLPLELLPCDICPGQTAVWSYSTGYRKVKISKLAAAQLIAQNLLDPKKLKMYVRFRHNIFHAGVTQITSLQTCTQSHYHRESPVGPHHRRCLCGFRDDNGPHCFHFRSVLQALRGVSRLPQSHRSALEYQI